FPAPGVSAAALSDAAKLASLADETPEGKSIVALALRNDAKGARQASDLLGAEFVEFTAQTRMSGVNVSGRSIRKGAADAVRDWVGKPFPREVEVKVEEIAKSGGTPLVVADQQAILGAIHLK